MAANPARKRALKTKNDELLFFDGNASGLALYQTLRDRLLARYPGVDVRVSKTQISFYNRCLFAMVSLPRGKAAKHGGLVVSFGLGEEKRSPRIPWATEAYPGRWTHHAPVERPEDVDEELLLWLEEAYRFALNKRPRR